MQRVWVLEEEVGYQSNPFASSNIRVVRLIEDITRGSMSAVQIYIHLREYQGSQIFQDSHITLELVVKVWW
jgi:hypothetical protein